MNIILLSLGGGAGAILRFLLGKALMRLFPSPPIPVSMLTVNILGSLGLGVFFGKYFGAVPAGAYSDSLFLLIGVGFFGAFTTFSTFSVEAYQLLESRKLKPLFIYLFLSAAGSLLAFIVGYIFSI
ncbi:fluoride efflux transporter CrcB [Alteribacillus sp. HJP-4]|uniref:fluoride efflux transporter CrcB n=1 Tax=Alteribacillus sp. HJP-4 TaxID=2775394 RepID=UPI0035CCC8BB